MSDGILADAAPAVAAAPADKTAPVVSEAAVAPAAAKPAADGTILAHEGTKPDASEGAQAKADTTPADIEVKLPEGVEADPDLMSALKSVAKEAGLKGEYAQKLADAYVAAQSKAQESARVAWEARKTEWVDTVKKDAELGGAKFAETVTVANRALAKYGTPELRQLLQDSGLNSHPEVARLFARVGRTLMEDSIAGTSNVGTGSNANSEESVLRSLFPSSYNVKE
jgi:hypothetical protein